MPHLPATWKERKEADMERRIERVQLDQRFQWLRTRNARRILVVVSTLLIVGIIPAWAQVGAILGMVVTAAAFAAWWLLGMSTRSIADIAERFLDERQRDVRNRSYLVAYRMYVSIIGALATVGLVAFVLVSESDAVTLTTTVSQAFGGVFFILALAMILPSMVVAWNDAGETHG